MKYQFAGDIDAATRILTTVVEDNALGYWPAEVELAGALGR